jgi:hypothetical protein
MDNVKLKAPDNGQCFNYFYTRGINIEFIAYPIHYERANPMLVIFLRKCYRPSWTRDLPHFMERDLFLHATTPSELIIRQWNLVLSPVHYLVLNERRINCQCARRNKMKFTYDVLSYGDFECILIFLK